MGEKASELAGLLRSLPVVLPASGSCAPLDPASLSFQRTELAQIPNVEIPLDKLKLFPEEPPPFELPPPSVPPPPRIQTPAPPPVFVHEAPRPPSAWPSAQKRRQPAVPLEVEKKRKRSGSRGMIVLDVLVLLSLALGLAYRSPLGKHPIVKAKTAQATAYASSQLHRLIVLAQR